MDLINTSTLEHKSFAQRFAKQTTAAIAFVVAFVLAFSPGLAFAAEGTQGGTQASATEQQAVETELQAESQEQSDETPGVVESDQDQGSESTDPAASGESNGVQSDANDQGSLENDDAESVEGSIEGDQGISTQSADETLITTQADNTTVAYTAVSGSQTGSIKLGLSGPASGVKSGEATAFQITTASSVSNPRYQLDEIRLSTGPNSFDTVVSYPSRNYNNATGGKFSFNFKAPGTYRITVSAISGSNGATASSAQFDITVTGSGQTLDTVVNNIVNQCAFLNAYDRVVFIHDWIINNAKLDSAGEYTGASGVLLYGHGTDESFASAMQLVLSRAGITAVKAQANGRVWSLVNFPEGWAHVDTALDSKQSVAELKHLYFGVTDDQMKRVNPSFSPNSNRKATNWKIHYFMNKSKDGYIPMLKMWADPIYKQIQTKINTGNQGFNITVPNSSNKLYSNNDVYNIVCDDVAKYFNTNNQNIFNGQKYRIGFVNKGPSSYSTSYFSVRIADLTSSYTSITGINAKYNCTGSQIKPSPTVTFDGTKLVEGTDYTVSYANNVYPGNDATVTITGIGEFSGTVKRTFKIVATSLYAPTVTGKWKKSKGKWWFAYDAASQKAQGKTYPADEWVKINGKVYHFDSAGWMHAKWQKIEGTWYWFGSDGAMRTGWQKIKGKWYWLEKDGAMAIGSKVISGKRYYLTSSGAMKTGWSKETNGWRYYTSSGAMKTGWFKSKGKWYYLDPANSLSDAPAGLMKTGTQKIGNSYYYLKSSGAMATGWVQSGSKWYHYKNSGARSAGWVKSKGKWYYMDPEKNDAMLAGSFNTIGGKRYFFDNSGRMLTGWVSMLGSWYYCDKSGAMKTNSWISGKYWVGSDGAMVTEDWVDEDRYWVGKDGKWIPNYKKEQS